MPSCRTLAHRADEPRAAGIQEREDGEKIGRVQRDVHFAVHRLAARLDVGDLEEMLVCAAAEANGECLAHGGMCPVASGQIIGRAPLL